MFDLSKVLPARREGHAIAVIELQLDVAGDWRVAVAVLLVLDLDTVQAGRRASYTSGASCG